VALKNGLTLVVSLSLLFLASCSRQRVERVQSPSTAPPSVVFSQTAQESNPISYLDPKSVAVTNAGGESISIGDVVSDELKAKTNTSIQRSELGVPFGPIDGFADSDIRIGWNNRNRVIYIEALSNAVRTADGLQIGSTRDEVVQTLGTPYMEDDLYMRYQNNEVETIGILFRLDASQKVVGIVLFTYV